MDEERGEGEWKGEELREGHGVGTEGEGGVWGGE